MEIIEKEDVVAVEEGDGDVGWKRMHDCWTYADGISLSNRLVEVGRIILINAGPQAGQLAAIVEIVDHKRVRPPRNFHESYCGPPLTSRIRS